MSGSGTTCELSAAERHTYEALVIEHLTFLLDRYERAPGAPFLNTKVDTRTGREFGTAADAGTVLAGDILFGWVQARAVESLAGHLQWLAGRPVGQVEGAALLGRRCRNALSGLIPAVQELRARNDGRLSYMMDQEGRPLCIDARGAPAPLAAIAGDANFNDLFFAKGLIAAGRALQEPQLRTEGEAAFRRVVQAIRDGRFVSDQLPLNPRVTPSFREGRREHGPAMISLGGVALLLDGPSAEEWAHHGAAVINRILDRHVQAGDGKELRQWDFSEFVDVDGNAWEEDGQILCDPGHALEFVGLACKFLLEAEGRGVDPQPVRETRRRCRSALPLLFHHVFGIGFNPRSKGIYRTVDLKSRKPANSDMPWWSLPETIRAAVLLGRLQPDADPAALREARLQCHDAFFHHYLNPDCHHLPYRIREHNGAVADRFPSFPDVDPGYHAGLSIIDILRPPQDA